MGWGMSSSNMHTSKLDKYTVLDTVFIKLDWQKGKDKEYMAVKINSMIPTAVHFFFRLVRCSKHCLSYRG